MNGVRDICTLRTDDQLSALHLAASVLNAIGRTWEGGARCAWSHNGLHDPLPYGIALFLYTYTVRLVAQAPILVYLWTFLHICIAYST